MKRIVFALIIILVFAADYYAEVLTTGQWNIVVGAGDLTGGAGTTLPASFESMAGVTTVTIANEQSPWRLMARYAHTNWNNAVSVMIKRTSDGSGAGSISGGSSYVELSTVDTEICSGDGDRSNVALQYKLTGTSLHVSPGLYSTSIIFTVVH